MGTLPSSLDPTFGSQGITMVDYLHGQDVLADLALQLDGKIVASGFFDPGQVTLGGIARLNADGSPDLSFGDNGKVGITWPGNADLNLVGVAIEGSKIVAVGSVPGEAIFARDFGLVRVTSTGTLDDSFGNGGMVSTHVPPDPHGIAGPTTVKILGDGRIVVPGVSDPGTPAADWVLAFYQPNGSLDTPLGAGGLVRTDLTGGEDALDDALVQADGNIVAVGASRQPALLELARYLGPPPPADATPPQITPQLNGTLGGNGWYTSNVDVSWIVTDPDSSVSSQSGCEATVVSADSAGITFTCNASSGGGSSSNSVTIKRDTTPPTLVCNATPDRLWPANKKLVPVASTITVHDALAGAAGFNLIATAASDGDPASDIVDWALGTPDTTGELRAARTPPAHERTYTLTYEGSDLAGNSSTCALAITVGNRQH